MNDLKRAWAALETEAIRRTESLETLPTGVAVAAGEVRIGADDASRLYVLIPLAATESFAEDRSGRSVHLIRIAHGHADYLALVCQNPDLNPVFRQFAIELIAELAGCDTAAAIAIAALARWRDLFATTRAAGVLSDDGIKGLIGELLVLEAILDSDPERRLGAWTGPNGHQHDFCFPDAHLEVKATKARTRREVSISSVEQLVPPPGGTLHLIHFLLEADPHGETVPGLCERVLDMGVQRLEFLKLLSSSGYDFGSQDEHYAAKAYRIVERRCYDTSVEGFPRIVPQSFVGGTIPAGATRLTYAIDLTREPPHPLSDTEVVALLDRLARS
jgi:hypothetical protein